jgi:hypothetical protein
MTPASLSPSIATAIYTQECATIPLLQIVQGQLNSNGEIIVVLSLTDWTGVEVNEAKRS